MVTGCTRASWWEARRGWPRRSAERPPGSRSWSPSTGCRRTGRQPATGRIGTEGRDLPALGEELPEPIVELLGRHSRHGVVGGDGAPLLRHLTRGIQTRDALESRTGKPSCGLADFRLERAHGWVLGDSRIEC